MSGPKDALTDRQVRSRRLQFAVLCIVGSLLAVSGVAVGIPPSLLLILPMLSGVLGALLLFFPNRRTVGTGWLVGLLAASSCFALALGGLLAGDAASVVWYGVCAGVYLLAVVRAPNDAWRNGRMRL